MAQHIQGQFGYRNIQLTKTAALGTGSYGAVYKAVCDDLTCAGKILHPTLFQSNDPGATTIMRRFQQECSFLSAIRHPNIVQYLGSYQDPETQLPVLLMELTLCTRKWFVHYRLLTRKLMLSVWGQSSKRCLGSPGQSPRADLHRQHVTRLD